MLRAPMFIGIVAVIRHEAEEIFTGVVVQTEDVAEFVCEYVAVSVQFAGVVSDYDVRRTLTRDPVS